MNGWRSIGASALLAVAAGWAPVHAAGLGVCRADAEEQLTPTCREAIAGAGPSEVVALIEPWIAAQNYVGALRVLQEARRRHPSNATLQLREHEVQSLADEAAWVARGRRAEASRPDDELALTQTRCLGLTGEAALAACEKALQSKPDEPRLLVARGDLLLTLGRTAEAEASYRSAATRDPSPALEKKIALAAGASRSPAAPNRPGDELPAFDAASLGRYHALVIGNDTYEHLERLDTAATDARAVGELLANQYGFEVTPLINATRAQIVDVLDEYRNRLRANDNLLIYYAGHGSLDAEADKGYWLPIDAQPHRRTQWVSNDTVRDTLRALKARHVLVVADSCFSGTLTRGAELKLGRGQEHLERMASLKSRQVLSSGGLEPVADSSGSGHSPFAAALLRALESNRGILDATSLFAELRRPVALDSEQLPHFADIRLAGHEGGDFLFVRRK
jgi:tetratricopeptide (TPR) repeat protein